MVNGPVALFLKPFEAPELKIERARYHYAAMLETLLDYQAIAKPGFIKTERQSDAWQIDIDEPVPSIVALQLGDIAHSLRSSLDVTLCDLAAIRGIGLSDLTYPFAADENRFLEMLAAPKRKQPFKKLGADAINLIKESKPYGGGNVLLRGLLDLNNHDKHRMAVPYVSFVSTTGTNHKILSQYGGSVIQFGGSLVGLNVGEPIPDEFFIGHPSNEYIINPTSMIVTFPTNYVLGGNIITVMGQVIDHVDHLVESFRLLGID